MRSVAVLLPLAVLFATIPPAAAEGPVDWNCDATGRLVCAGANVGANVNCSLSGALASCAFTRGFVWGGASPTALPGRAQVEATLQVIQCVGASCTTTTYPAWTGACGWLPASSCGGDVLSDGVAQASLALGECMRLTVVQTATVAATTPDTYPLLASAQRVASGQDAGEVCRVDDGRER